MGLVDHPKINSDISLAPTINATSSIGHVLHTLVS